MLLLKWPLGLCRQPRLGVRSPVTFDVIGPFSELAAGAILIIITFMRSQNQDSVGIFAALFVFLFGSPSILKLLKPAR